MPDRAACTKRLAEMPCLHFAVVRCLKDTPMRCVFAGAHQCARRIFASLDENIRTYAGGVNAKDH